MKPSDDQYIYIDPGKRVYSTLSYMGKTHELEGEAHNRNVTNYFMGDLVKTLKRVKENISEEG